MKFKAYTPSLVGSMPKRGPAISINKKSGVFHLNAAASQFMALKEKSKILLGNDPDFPDNWYLKIANGDDDAFTLRANTGTGSNGSLFFNTTGLTRIFFDHFKIDKPYVRISIGNDPIKDKSGNLYPLITAPLMKGSSN